jgi:hypothetical protein
VSAFLELGGLLSICQFQYACHHVGQISSGEPNMFRSEEIPRSLWNPKFHYCVHKSTILVPVLSQVNPVCATLSFFKNDFSVIVHSRLISSKGCLSFTLPDQNPGRIPHLPHTYLPRAPPTPFSFIWSPLYYLAKSTNCETSEY